MFDKIKDETQENQRRRESKILGFPKIKDFRQFSGHRKSKGFSRETRQREIKGILACAKEFGLKEGLIITKDYSAEEKIGNKKIKFIPLWKWLLEDYGY